MDTIKGNKRLKLYKYGGEALSLTRALCVVLVLYLCGGKAPRSYTHCY